MRFFIFIITAIIVFCPLSPHAAEQKLKIPAQYLGAWETTAKRIGNFVHVIKGDGTIVGYLNSGNKQKYSDMTYRVLDVKKDVVVLFVQEIQVKDPFTGQSPGYPIDQYWTLKPDGVYDHSPFMWIISSGFLPWREHALPHEKSNQWLLDYYLTVISKDLPKRGGHIKLPPGRFEK